MSLEWLLRDGGPVVWVLTAYSVVGLTIVVERLLHYAHMGRAPEDLAAHLPGTVDHWQRTPGPEAAVILAMLTSDGPPLKAGERARMWEMERLERGLPTLSVLGNTAPLWGLLGTVTGMIKAFQVIEAAGGRVDAQALAGGIWEAMITTAVGLGVAIPLLLLLHLLEGVVQRRGGVLERCLSLAAEHLADPGRETDRAP